MTKYAVITCTDREIDVLGVYNSKSEAYENMLEDFIKIVNPDKEDLENEGTDYFDWGIDETSAWANSPENGSGDDYDWKIVEV